MDKIKSFVVKYTAEILIVLGAISAVLTQLQTDGVINTGTTATILIIAILIEILKNGVTEASIKLIAEAINIIIEEISKKENVEKVMGASAETISVEDRLRNVIK